MIMPTKFMQRKIRTKTMRRAFYMSKKQHSKKVQEHTNLDRTGIRVFLLTRSI